MTIGKKRLICLPIIAIVIALFIAANIVAGMYSVSITALLCPPLPNTALLDETRAQGQALSEEIVGEGSVLVKNDGILPLSSDVKKVNVFGYIAFNMVLGGWGAGRVLPETDDTPVVDIPSALSSYGIEYNTALARAYMSMGDKDAPITNKAFYSDELLSNAENYSDTAIVVLGRANGEGSAVSHGNDGHDLDVTDAELSVLEYVGKNFENVIVVINGTNHMQLDFLDTVPGLDACFVCGTFGTHGAAALPELIWGDRTPSGKLSDTLPYDFTDSVTYYNSDYGLAEYTGMESLGSNFSNAHFVDYVEGVYVGYRYYETADAEGVWDGRSREVLGAGGETVSLTGYDAVVQYPFGYGLSYTDFSWEITGVEETELENGTTDISVTVRVTNISGEKGKDVVQLYMTAPYEAGVTPEMPSVVLVDFAKTIELYPSSEDNGPTEPSSCEVTLTVNTYDMASYDCYDVNKDGHTGYELSAGDYVLRLMTDSHTPKIMPEGEFGNSVTYTVSQHTNFDVDPTTGKPVDNLFTGEDAVDGVSVDGLGEYGGNQNITYITRENMTSDPVIPTGRAINEKIAEWHTYDFDADSAAWDNAQTDAFGNKVNATPVSWGSETAGDKVYDSSTRKVTELGYFLGDPANFDDPAWDKLLNQVTRTEAVDLTDLSQAGTRAVNSIGKPALRDVDGPMQAGGYSGVAIPERGTGYPSATTFGQTFNKTLATDFGRSMAADLNAIGFDGLYGLGLNLHRSLFNGRNYEYYSEDPLLSGALCARAMKGMKQGGKYGFLKHFALNETDPDRYALYTWVTEQALREVYLKPFRMVVVSESTSAVMTAYNRVGGVWAGGSTALVTGVLKNEWDFKGGIITDYASEDDRQNRIGYMNMDQAIRAGGNLSMYVSYTSATTSANSDRLDNALRSAVKNSVFMWLNVMYENNEYNKNPDDGKVLVALPSTPSFVWWIPLLVDVDIVVFGGCAIALFLLLAPLKRNNAGSAPDDNGEKGGN